MERAQEVEGAIMRGDLLRTGRVITVPSMPEKYEISTDAARFDLDLIHNFLRSSYWAHNIPREIVEKCIRNSLCFGAFADGRQVGFARAITDRATFAYLADIFIIPEYRGLGISKLMLRAILDHPDLRGLR